MSFGHNSHRLLLVEYSTPRQSSHFSQLALHERTDSAWIVVVVPLPSEEVSSMFRRQALSTPRLSHSSRSFCGAARPGSSAVSAGALAAVAAAAVVVVGGVVTFATIGGGSASRATLDFSTSLRQLKPSARFVAPMYLVQSSHLLLAESYSRPWQLSAGMQKPLHCSMDSAPIVSVVSMPSRDWSSSLRRHAWFSPRSCQRLLPAGPPCSASDVAVPASALARGCWPRIERVLTSAATTTATSTVLVMQTGRKRHHDDAWPEAAWSSSASKSAAATRALPSSTDM
mmetsp:Transcript_60713/g.171100  ORF Transcript_60713/g.171100 Transcript_60713/m.171100 type:complete len:285 (-) Transcript_60713:107-961(-)